MARFARWLLVALAVPALAFAHGGVDAAKRSVEASMLVTGEIAVNPDGSVYGYSLDHRDKLPPEIVKLITEALPGWQFAPIKVDGKPVLAKALMSLRVVASQTRPNHFAAEIKSAVFGDDTPQAQFSPECAHGACLTYGTRQPPAYPLDLARDGVSGTVYVVVEVNQQGRVADAAVSQVNLRRVADETELARWRREFARATLTVVPQWRFNVPQTGNQANQNHWFVTIPVNYSLDVTQNSVSDYGHWDVYVPGPAQQAPWAKQGASQTASTSGSDATPDNGAPFIADTRFVLLTPLGGNSAAKPSPEASPGQG